MVALNKSNKNKKGQFSSQSIFGLAYSKRKRPCVQPLDRGKPGGPNSQEERIRQLIFAFVYILTWDENLEINQVNY